MADRCEHDDQGDDQALRQHHHHDCGNLFGCGDEKDTGVVREDDLRREMAVV